MPARPAAAGNLDRTWSGRGSSGVAAMPMAPAIRPRWLPEMWIEVAGGLRAGLASWSLWRMPPMYNCPPGWHSGPFGRRCFRNGLVIPTLAQCTKKAPRKRGFSQCDADAH